jgi:DNA repair protein RadC
MIHPVPRIHDLPDSERPREKLCARGAAALDHAELLALFLGSGVRGRSAIEIGRELVTRYGSLGALGRLDVTQLAATRGIGLAKACHLAAAFELGARVAREQLSAAVLDSPEAIHQLLAPELGHLSHESLRVLLLDTRLRHAGWHEVSRGTVNETVAHPREILRPVLLRAAYGFVLVHNHPSGDPSPSHADRELTRRVRDAAALMQIRFLDHLIIGKPAPSRPPWFSFREAGEL